MLMITSVWHFFAAVVDMFFWMVFDRIASMMDKCAAGIAGLNKVLEHLSAQVFKALCNSHTLCEVGNKFIGPELALVFKAICKMFMHKTCNARSVYYEVFGHYPESGGGVRWWAKWELIWQVFVDNIERFFHEVVLPCVAKGYSEKSAKKLKALLSNPLVMAKVIVQAAAHAAGGRPFCVATYLLESNAPMVFMTWHVLRELDKVMVLKGDCTMLQQGAQQAFKVLQPMLLAHDEKIEWARKAVMAQQTELASARERLAQYIATHHEDVDAFAGSAGACSSQGDGADTAASGQHTSTRGPGRKRLVSTKQRATNEEKETKEREKRESEERKAEAARAEVLKQQQQLATMKDAEQSRLQAIVDSNFSAMEGLEATLEKELSTLAQIKARNPTTLQELVQHGLDAVAPGLAYYALKYNQKLSGEESTLSAQKKAFMAAEIFHPERLLLLPPDVIEMKIDELRCFKFVQFGDDFLAGMKQEVEKVQKLAERYASISMCICRLPISDVLCLDQLCVQVGYYQLVQA